MSSSLLSVPFMMLPMGGAALALPGDGTVVAGQANINTVTPSHMTVTQGSNTAIINWNGFSIGNGETVQFVQPGQSSLAVNRVLGDDPSNIFGSLIANGQIMLINPNGVLFGPNSRVDVGGLIATTIDIDDEKILGGDFTFDKAGNPAAAVVNQGTITAADGGLVALVAPGVSNSGVIQARLGKVTLAGANKFSVDLYGDGLVSLPVSSDTVGDIYDAQGNPLSASVSNSGTIKADGGNVTLSARTAKSLVDDAVNMTGVIEAKSVHMKNGVIVLDGGAGKTRVSGTINASGKQAGEKGGTVKITGDTVAIDNGARIDASGDAGGGTIHIGGEYQGGGTMARARETIVAADTVIDASAITDGDGGEVVVWSDGKTKFSGTIRANGGAEGGNGGRIETSGKETLSVTDTAHVEASAPMGTGGHWLLDPRDVYLRNGVGANVSGGGIYNPSVDDASVNIATINTALASGLSVTITTNDITGAQPGNLTLVDAMNVSPTGAATLTLIADNNIVLNNSITSTGSLNLILTATGNITQSTGTVNTGGGNLTINATDIALSGSGFNVGAGTITINNAAAGTIALGSGAGGMSLSSAELAMMTANILKIGNGSSGAITIGADITPGATSLHLHTGSTITGTAGGIIATNLALQAGGTINITDASSNVTNVAVSAAGQTVTYNDTNAVNIGSVNGIVGATATTLNLMSGGAMTDSAAIAATTLNVTAGGAVTLDTATNNVTNLGINAGANAITYVDTNGFDVTGLTGSTINLTGAGAMTDTGTITGTTLTVSNNNTVTFNSAGNNVNAINIAAGANAVTYTDSNALDIAGLTASTATISSGALTDSGTINVTNLNVTASGNVTLNTATNNASAININAGANSVTYVDTNGFDIAGLIASSATLTGGGAITDSAPMQIATMNVTSTGAITLNEAANDFDNLTVSAAGQTVTMTDADAINLAGITAGSFILNAGGAVTDSAAIIASTLNVTAPAAVTLDFATNDVDSLIVSAAGQAVMFRDADGLGLAGILANSLTLVTGGALTDSVAMQIADLNVTSTGAVTLDEAANDFDNIIVSAAGQTVSVTDADGINLAGVTAGTMNINAGGVVTDSAATAATTLNVTATGAVTLDHAANDVTNLTVSAGANNITYNDVNAVNLAGITGANLVLTAGGAVTDSAATVVSDLDITTSGAVTLDHAANNAATIDINAGANAITYVDTNGVIIDELTGTTATITAGGTVTDNGPINAGTLNVTATGAVTIDNLANNINVFSALAAGQNVIYTDANGIDIAGITASNFTLNAGGAVTDSGNIVVGTLNATASGNVTLNSAGNNATTININAGANSVTYVDTNGFDIAGLIASSATLTGGGAITDSAPMQIATMNVTSTGAITLNEAANDFDNLTVSAAGQTVTIVDADALNLAGVTAGTVNLTAGGALTDSAATIATNLNITNTAGATTLDFASNDVDNLNAATAGQALTFRDADGINLAGITADTFSLQTGGAVTDSVATILTGAATINAGANAVTLDVTTNDFNAVTLTSAAATLVDTDDITLNASTLSGALTVQANNGITIAGNVTANGVTMNADQDTNGAGDLTVNGGAALSSNNNLMTITANDLAITGTTTSGTNTTNIIVSDNGTIDIGNGGGGAMNISAAEIAAMNGNIVKIGNASSGAITISSDVTPGATNLHLQTGSTITGTAGGITATGLALQAGGTVNMTDATTDVANLAISAGANPITFADASGFNITTINGVAGITGTTINLSGSGAITDTAATIGTNLTITNTGGATTLDVATNDVDNLTVTGTGQNVTFRDADGINLAGIDASSFTLQAGGAVTDSVAMQVAAMNVTSTGAITLNEAANDFDNLFISNAGQTTIVTDVDDLNLAGITAGTFTLNAGGAVTDTLATIATNLNITTTGAVTLDVATNDVDNLFVSAAGQAVAFRDVDGINLAGITADTFGLTAGGAVTDSVATVVANLGISATGAITLDVAGNDADTVAFGAAANNVTYVDTDGFNIGTVGTVTGLTAGTASLTAGGAVTQSNAIAATNLGVTATGAVTLDNAANNVASVGISAAGQAVSYRDTNAVAIANVGGANGITAGSLDLVVGGALTDTAATVVSGHTNITAGASAITLDTATNDFNTVNLISGAATTIVDTNAITFTNITGSNALTVNANNGITLSGNSVSNGATIFNADADNNGSGNFTLDATYAITTSNDAVTISAADLILNGTIGTGTATTAVQATNNRTIDVGTGGGGQFNVSQAELNAITAGVVRVGGAASGAMTISSDISAAGSNSLHLQSAGTITGTAGGVIETNLAITAGGAVTITDASTDVDNLALSTTNQNVTFVDVDGVNFGNVSTLTGTALGTGTLLLTAGGAVTDGHNMTGGSLGVTSTGAITLNNTNNFNNVAFSAAGQAVTYNDSNAINIATVGAVTGITAGSLNLSATTGGITDASATTVTGATTLAGGTGGITLDLATNDFNTLTISSGTAVTVRDGNAMTISASTTSGATNLSASNGLTVAGNITSGGALVLNADADANATGTLTLNTATTTSTSAANQTIALQGADLVINGTGAVNSGTATTTMQAFGTTRTVDIGGAGATYNISQAEIDAVTAGALRIVSGTGAATVTLSNATLTAAGTNSLHLQGGSAGVNTSAGAITIANLALQASAGGVINATNAGNDVDNLAISAGNGTVRFTDVDGVNIGSVNGINGLTGTGATLITAAGITDSSASTVTNFAFNSTGTVVLDNANNFGTIAGTAAGQSVTINDTNALILGQVTAGSVFNGITADNLTLTVGGALTDTQASSIANNTTITAGVNAVTLDVAGNDFNTVSIVSAGNTRIDDVDDITMGASNITGTLAVNANNGITVSNDVTTSGAATFDADLDNNGSGTFTVDATRTVNTTNTALNIIANDVALNGNLNSGSADTTIGGSSGQTIGLGDTPQTMTIGKAELSRITAENLNIGGNTTGNITVDNIAAADVANINDTLNLDARANAANIYFINNPSTFKTIFAEADDSIYVDENLTSTVGQISLTADVDGAADPNGDQVYVSPGVDINAAADAIFLSQTGITIGTNVTVLGPLVINADTDGNGIGSLTINGGVTILTNNNDLSMTAADYFINGIINAGTGRVSIETTNGRTIGVGDAAGDAQISKAELARITAGQLYIGGANTGNITVDNVSTTDLAGIAGLVTFAALFNGAGVYFDNADSSFGNALTLTADDEVSINANVTANGLITIDSDVDDDSAGDFAVTATHTLSSTGNNINITANDMNIAGNVTATGATVSLLASDNAAIDLGGAGGGLNLSAAELANFTAGTLRIGNASHGAITISGDIAPASVGSLFLHTGSTVTGTAGGIAVANLGISAGGAVNITDANTDVDTLAINTTTGNITFNDLDAVTVDTVTGVTGLSTGAGSITLRATDMDLLQAVNAGAGTVTLEGAAAGTIGLGGAGGALNLTAAELAQITANILHIGTGAAGAITVSGDATLSTVGRLELQTGAGITGTAGGLVVGDLALAAGGAVNFTDTTTDVNTLSVNAAGQAITFFDADDVSVALTGATANISANNGITVTADFAGNGASSFNADADNNGSGTFTTNAGIDIATTNNTLDITARDIVLDPTGTLNSGAAATNLLVSNGGTISLGGAGGNMALANNELNTITAGTLRIGDATAGAITVAADIAPSGTNTLHLRSGSTITGTAGGITETNLALSAGGTINFTDTTTDVGTIAVSAPAQNVTFRDASGIIIGTVDGVVGVNAGTFNLTSGGAVTDTAAITATTLDVTSTGAVTLDAAGTDVDNFAVSAAGQTVALTDIDGVNLNNATAGTLTINAGDAVTDSGTIAVTTLNVTTSTGGVTLNTAANDADNINISAAGQAVTFTDTDGFNINALTGQNVQLTAGGAVTDSGTITADSLNITGTGSITLDTAANDVNDLTVSAAGQTVAFTDVDGVNLAGINATSFTLNAGGAVTDSAAVTAGAFNVTSTGPVTLDFATSDVDTLYMSAAGQTVSFTDADGFDITGLNATTANLTAGGAATDSGTITATNFNITGTGSITLNTAANDVDNLYVSAAGQTVTFTDVDGINLAGIIAGTANVQTGGAVTDSAAITAGTFNLTSTGPVTLDFATTDVDNLNISAGGQTVAFTDADGFNITGLAAASATLTAAGAVTDSGAIVAGTLNLTNAAGGVTLDNATNDVDDLNINAAGQTAIFTDVDGVNLTGITAQTFTLNAGGGVTDTGAVTADTFNVTTTAGGITLDMVTSDVNDLNLSAVGQTASFTDADGVNLTGVTADTFTLSAGGAVTDSGTVTAGTLNVTTSTGGVALNTAANDVDNLNISAAGQAVTFVDTDGFNINALTGQDVQLTAGGAVTDSGTIAADTLNITGTGSITLDTATNDVNGLTVNASGQTVAFTDTDGVDLAGITAGTFTLNAGGAVTDSAAITATTLNVTTSTGGVALDHAASDVDNLNIIAAAQTASFTDVDGVDLTGITAGTFTLNAGGAVTDSGTITAGTLNVTTSTGGVTLNTAANDVDVLTIGAAGQAAIFTDTDGIDLAGITANSFTLSAGGAVTDSGTIAAATLNVTSTGPVTLNTATNDVDALTVSAAGQNVTFVDVDGIDLAGITAADVNLTTGGAITDSVATAATGTTTLNAGAGNNITLDAAANDFNMLAVTAGNNVLLRDVNALTLNASTISGTLDARAANNLSVAGNITTNGATILNADSDNNGTGTLTVSGGNTVDTTNNALTITADDLSLAGALNSGSAITTILVSNGGTITLGGGGGDMSITNPELNAITADILRIGDASAGNITVVADIAPAGTNTLHLRTGAAITGTAGGITETNVALEAGTGINISDTTTAIGTLAASTAAGTINIDDSGTMTVGIVDGVTGITSAGGNITLQSTDMDIQQAINAGAGIVTLLGDAAGTISLGGAGGALALTNAELNAITAGTLRIGDATAGNMTIVADIAPAGTNTLNLRTGGSIDGTAGGITETNLAMSAGTGITLTDTTTNIGTLAATNTVADIHVIDSGLLTIGTVDGVTGVTAAAGDITLQAGDMDIQQAINSGGDITTLLGVAGNTISLGGAGGALALTNAELNAITAGTLRIGDVAAGNITVVTDIAPAGTGTLHLRTGGSITGTAGGITETDLAMSAGTGITLTDTTTNIGTLAATSAAGAVTIHDTGSLTIGTVDGVTGITATGGNLTLTAGDYDIQQAINNGANITTLLTAPGNTISLGGAGGGMALSNAELDAITAGILRIGDSSAGNITVVADIAPAGTNTLHLRTGGSIDGTAGGITETNLAMSAGTGITLTDTTTDIGTVAGTTTTGSINIDDAGTLTIGTVDGVTGLGATTGNITLQATDMDIQQAINSGAGIVTLTGDAADTISLGGAGGALALTNAELNAITAGILRIGDAAAGNITVVADIAPAGTGTLHLRTGGSIDGTAGGITETNLAMSAGTGITLSDTTTNIGTLGAVTTAGNISVLDSGLLTIGTVDGVTGVTGTAGDITLQAGNMDIQQAINSGANITTLLGASGGTISLGGGAGALALTNAEINAITAGILRIGDASAGAITIASDIAPAGTNTLHLRTGSGITGTAGGITVTNLAMSAGGTINVNDTTTDVDVLAIAAPGQSVTFRDADDVTFGTVDGVSGIAANIFTLIVGGAVIDNGPIIMDTLNITAAGNVTLDNALNDVNNLSISAAGFDAIFNDADDINLTGINTGTFTLTAGGAVTDSGTITTGTLDVTTTGPVTLNTAANDVNNLAIDAGGQPIIFVDADGLNINALNGSAVTLTAGGAVTQSGAITTGTMTLNTSAGGATLNHAGNDVDNLTVASAGQTVAFTDADGINLAGINAGTFTLNAGGAVTDSAAITAGTLDITAGDDVTLDFATSDVNNLAISAAGQNASFTDADGINLTGITADSFTLAAGGTVTDSGTITVGTLSVTATDDVTLDTAANDVDNVGISAAGQPIIFVDTDGFNITGMNGAATTLTAGGAITQSGAVTASTLNITAGGGVTMNHAGNDADNLIVSAAGQAVAFTDSDALNLAGINAGSFTLVTNGAVTDSAPSAITGATSITAGAGNNVILDTANDFGSIAVVSGNNVTINDINAVTLAGSTISGALNVTAATGITQSGNVTVGGTATLDADLDNNGVGDFTINGGQTLAVSGATLNITANDYVLNGAINHAGGTTTLLVSDNGTVSLGGAGGDAALSNAELNNITTNILRIGDAAGGAITVAGNIAPAGVTTLHLRSAGAVTGTAGAVDVDNLAVNAGGTVDLSNASNDVTNVAIAAPGQAISFRDANAANITTVDGVTGITGSSATLQTGGALSATAAIAAPTLSIISGGTVSLASATNNVTDLSVAAPGQTVSFLDAGGINLSGVNAGTFTLTTTGAVTDSGTVAVTGTTTIAVGAGNNITLDTLTNDFGTVAITTGRHVTLRDANALTIGASTISGLLDAGANNGVTIAGAVTTAGVTTIDADLDNNGTGNFTMNGGASLATANNALNITADDIVLNGTISSGSAGTTIAASTPGATWGLGNAAGDVTLSGAELQRITASTLTLGGADAGTITADGVSAAHTAGINNMILNALGNNSRVRFINNASTFRAITANADAGIDALVNVTANAGAMNFDGDADNADDPGNDAITYGANVQLTSAGNMNLSATTGGGIMNGNLTLQSGNGDITIDTLDGPHNLTINAPNGDITITGSIGAVTPLHDVAFTGEDATGDIHADTLSLEMDSAILTGTIAGLGGEDAAGLIVLLQDLPGPYTMNGFLIEGYVPPPPPPAPVAVFNPSSQMPSPTLTPPWRNVEGRNQTIGDLMYQDPLRAPYIPDLLSLDDTFFIYTRDLMLSIIQGSITDVNLIRIIAGADGFTGDSDDDDDDGDGIPSQSAPPPEQPSVAY